MHTMRRANRWAALAAGMIATATVGAGAAEALPAPARPTAIECAAAFGEVATLPAIDYGTRFVRAVERGGKFGTQCFGSGQLTSMLFTEGATGGVWTQTGAEAGWGELHISYVRGAGETLDVTVLLGGRPGSGWGAVTEARVGGIRGPVSSYAATLVAAWNRGDRASAARLAESSVVAALWAHGNPGKDWRVDTLTARRGFTVVSISSRSGERAELLINAAAVAREHGQAVKAVAFG